LRRIVVIGTALAVLAAAATAYAATSGLNTYTAKIGFSPNKAGSGKAPSAIGFTERYTASGNNGDRTAPLTDIKTKIYGLKTNTKGRPTCSAAKINKAFSDAGCPKGALIATGSIKAILGPVADPSASNPNLVPCDPLLHAWNGGGGKIVFFFVDKAPVHTCGPLQTGGVPAFVGTAKVVGKSLVQDTPVPSKVSFPIPGVEGSLTSLTLGFSKAYNTSVACNKGKRPYSVTFTAESAPGAAPQSSTVSGTQKCS
jgi:hypothetical protein